MCRAGCNITNHYNIIENINGCLPETKNRLIYCNNITRNMVFSSYTFPIPFIRKQMLSIPKYENILSELTTLF